MQLKSIRTRHAGFTLIELIIYMAVLIVFGIILIQSTIYLSTFLVRREADELALSQNLRKLNLSIEYYARGLTNERLENEFGEDLLRPIIGTSSLNYGIENGAGEVGGTNISDITLVGLNFASTTPLLIQLK